MVSDSVPLVARPPDWARLGCQVRRLSDIPAASRHQSVTGTKQELRIMKSTITPTNVAAEINRLHNGIVGALRNTVTDAIEIGRLLTEHKASLAHGEWLPWLEANLSFDDRTARRYASLYENRAKLDSVSNLNDAYRLLSKPREHKPADKDSSRADGRAAGKRLLDKLPAGLTADQREQYAMGIAECVAAWLYLLRMERGDFAPKQA